MMSPMIGCGAGLLLWLVFLAILVVGLVVLVRALADRSDKPGNSALRILEERFARGEIDRDEFEDRRGTLRP